MSCSGHNFCFQSQTVSYRYDCLIPFFIWAICHYNFTTAQCAFPGYDFSINFPLQLFDYMLHTHPFLFIGVLCHLYPSILWNVYAILLLINIYLKFIIHVFGLSYYGLSIIIFFVSQNFLIFNTLLYFLFFLYTNNVSIVLFNLIFWGTFTRDRFTCFIDVNVYFLSISENISTIISLELDLFISLKKSKSL